MNEFNELIATIRALRHKETGCPWDRKQTLSTLIKPLQEETEELIAALSSNDAPHIAEELGDVVWNALMLLEVCEEENLATKSQVLKAVNEKMISRHPHVFADAVATTSEEAAAVYKEAKRQHRLKQKYNE